MPFNPLLLADKEETQFLTMHEPKPPVPAAAEESCESSVGSGAKAPAGAGQGPPGVQRAAPFGAPRAGA